MTVCRNLNDITYTTDEGRNQGDTSLGASDCLTETEEESEVAVDAVVTLEFTGGLNTFPCGSNLDQDTLLGDADGCVESNELLRLRLCALLVEGQTGVDLSGHTSRDDGKDCLAELDQLKRR